MSREYYEDDGNLSDERSVKQFLQEHSNYQFGKLPIRYNVDWSLWEGEELVQFMEFKRRHNNRYTYDTFFISLGKVQAGIDLARTTGAQFVIMVQFDDELAFHSVDLDLPYRIKWGGRFDRDDDQDSEPMVHIPADEFETVREGVVA